MADPIRLYLDEDTISRALISALKARNVNVLSAHAAGLVSTPDEEHLRFATAHGRAVFTFNTRDYARLHKTWMADGQHHAGIIVSDQIQVGPLLRRLLRLLDALSTDEMHDRLEFLGRWK